MIYFNIICVTYSGCTLKQDMQLEQFQIALGAAIAKRRKSLSLTQLQLANKCSMPRTFISLIERGISNMSFSTLLSICKALNLTPLELTDLALNYKAADQQKNTAEDASQSSDGSYKPAQKRNATPEQLLNKLSSIVRNLRSEMKLSQRGFAKRSGINQTYISSIEIGRRNPSFLVLIQIADASNMSPSEFFSFLSKSFEQD